jgi:hypothetical protein
VEQRDLPRVSLDEFLELTNVQFIDGFPMNKRKSMAASNSQDTMTIECTPALSSPCFDYVCSYRIVAAPTLASQVIGAAVLLPFLEMYHMVCVIHILRGVEVRLLNSWMKMSRELRASLSDNQSFIEAINADIEQESPRLFQQWFKATEEESEAMAVSHSFIRTSFPLARTDRRERTIQAQFKLTKNHFRLEVRNEWYDYRCSVFEEVCKVLGANLEALIKVSRVRLITLMVAAS